MLLIEVQDPLFYSFNEMKVSIIDGRSEKYKLLYGSLEFGEVLGVK